MATETVEGQLVRQVDKAEHHIGHYLLDCYKSYVGKFNSTNLAVCFPSCRKGLIHCRPSDVPWDTGRGLPAGISQTDLPTANQMKCWVTDWHCDTLRDEARRLGYRGKIQLCFLCFSIMPRGLTLCLDCLQSLGSPTVGGGVVPVFLFIDSKSGVAFSPLLEQMSGGAVAVQSALSEINVVRYVEGFITERSLSSILGMIALTAVCEGGREGLTGEVRVPVHSSESTGPTVAAAAAPVAQDVPIATMPVEAVSFLS